MPAMQNSTRIHLAVLICALTFTAAEPALAQTQDFGRFRKVTDGWKVLDDPVVKKRIKSLMGNRDEEFWNCAQLTDAPTVSGNDLLVVSCVRGLCPFMRSVLCLNLVTGKCYAAYFTDSKLHIYGAAGRQQLPSVLRNFLDKEVTADATIFEKADWTPRKLTKAPAAKKSLNLSTITGTYERENSSRFTEATLKVLELKGGKFAFDLQAANGGNTGGEQGTAVVVNHRATYRQNNDKSPSAGTLEFQFKGRTVVVTGNDEPFCGAGVTLLGTYAKSDDRPPADVR